MLTSRRVSFGNLISVMNHVHMLVFTEACSSCALQVKVPKGPVARSTPNYLVAQWKVALNPKP